MLLHWSKYILCNSIVGRSAVISDDWARVVSRVKTPLCECWLQCPAVSRLWWSLVCSRNDTWLSSTQPFLAATDTKNWSRTLENVTHIRWKIVNCWKSRDVDAFGFYDRFLLWILDNSQYEIHSVWLTPRQESSTLMLRWLIFINDDCKGDSRNCEHYCSLSHPMFGERTPKLYHLGPTHIYSQESIGQATVHLRAEALF